MIQGREEQAASGAVEQGCQDDGERNDTSLAMQVRLSNDAHFANAMLLGDHEYENKDRDNGVSNLHRAPPFLLAVVAGP